jgi:hypothetical protein
VLTQIAHVLSLVGIDSHYSVRPFIRLKQVSAEDKEKFRRRHAAQQREIIHEEKVTRALYDYIYDWYCTKDPNFASKARGSIKRQMRHRNNGIPREAVWDWRAQCMEQIKAKKKAFWRVEQARLKKKAEDDERARQDAKRRALMIVEEAKPRRGAIIHASQNAKGRMSELGHKDGFVHIGDMVDQEEGPPDTGRSVASSSSSESNESNESMSTANASSAAPLSARLGFKDSQSDDDEDNYAFPVSREERDLYQKLRWLTVMEAQPVFFEIMKTIPTADESKYQRDELAQFAVIINKLAYIYGQVVQQLEALKVAGEFQGMVRSRNRRGAGQQSPTKLDDLQNGDSSDFSDNELDLQGVMNEEAKRRRARLEAAQERRRRREEEWKYAHHHLYVDIPGEPIFCISCKTVRYAAWKDRSGVVEDDWANDFTRVISDKLEEDENRKKEEIMARPKDYYTQDRRKATKKAPVLQPLMEIDAEDSEGEPEIGGRVRLMPSDTDSFVTQVPAGMEEMSIMSEGILLPSELIKCDLADGDDASAEDSHPDELEDDGLVGGIPRGIVEASLSTVDPDGASIVPDQGALTAVAEEDAQRKALKGSINESLVDESIANPSEDGGPRLGIMLRVWNLVRRQRKEFMGFCLLTKEQLLDPPKGRRSFPLLKDGDLSILGDSEHLVPKGHLMLKVGIGKKRKGKIVSWRMEIIKGVGLLQCDTLSRSNPYVEVWWRGPAKRSPPDSLVFAAGEGAKIKDTIEILKQWQLVGVTAAKDWTMDPTWTKVL